MDDIVTSAVSVLLGALEARVRNVAPESIVMMYEELFADLVTPDNDGSVASEIVWQPAGDDVWHVSLGSGSPIAGDVAGGLAESIIEINRQAAVSVSAERTDLHAGAFEVGGGAIAVTGMSGAGKSTLVAAVVLRGHGHLADEVCAVDPADNSVQSYTDRSGSEPRVQRRSACRSRRLIRTRSASPTRGLTGDMEPWPLLHR